MATFMWGPWFAVGSDTTIRGNDTEPGFKDPGSENITVWPPGEPEGS